MSNFTKSVSLGAHNIAFSLLRKLVGTIPQVWEQSRPFLRWRVNLLWEQTQEGGNFLRACELADTTVPLYYDCHTVSKGFLNLRSVGPYVRKQRLESSARLDSPHICHFCHE